MYNFSRQNVLGYTINGQFHNLRNTYNSLLDEAFINVGQGKETFDSAMKKILSDIGGSGLKTLDYESGRSIRLDSAIRMHLKGRLRELHNENQKIYGDEFGADGIEISVHSNPAPDHELVQGRQFSLSEYEKLNSGLEAKDYKGNLYTLDHDGKNGYRPISEMNCYHYIFSIVLGVSEPEYTDTQLKQIINDNNKGFEYEGKHYTNYEGTQLQRTLEREIRKNKDIQILARESGNDDLVGESQKNITILTNKYRELANVSGLPTKMDRMRVSGYHMVKRADVSPPKPIAELSKDLLEQPLYSKEEYFNMLVGDLGDKNVDVDGSIMLVDEDIRNNQLEQLYNLTEKYPVDRYSDKELTLGCKQLSNRNRLGEASYYKKNIDLNEKYFKDKNVLLESEARSIKYNWHYKVPDDKLSIATITHEYGHQVEYEYFRRQLKKYGGRTFDFRAADKDLQDTIMGIAMGKLDSKITKTEFKKQYFSGYALSKRNYEWFAELFAKTELGEQDVFTEALKEWLGGFYG